MCRRHQFRGLAAASLLCAVLVSPALFAAADYGPTQVDGTAWNSERKVAVAPDGTTFVVFVERVNNTSAIFAKVSRDRGVTWTVLPRLSTAEAFRVCAAVDSGGSLHVAWTEYAGPERQLFYARWEAGPDWTGRLQISDTPGYSGYPSIGIDSKDRVHVVWYGFDGTTYQIYYRFRDSAGWHPTLQATHGVADANNPAIAIGPDDRVHVAFFTYLTRDLDVWYMVGGPAGFDLLQRVNPPGVDSTRPSIAVLQNGTPAVAYVSGSDSVPEVRLAQRDPSGNWSYNVPVSLLGEQAQNPSVVAGGADGLAVFYETAAGAVRYRTRDAGAWRESQTVPSAPEARWPSASWATFPQPPADGRVAVVWTETVGLEYRINFTTLKVFEPAPCNCPPSVPWWQDWAVPLLFVGGAAASMGALWLAAARTRGGGRG